MLISQPDTIHASNGSRHGRSLSVLHVEDDEMVAAVTREMLEAQGWHVETCGEGNAALARMVGHARYDAFLVDFDLPNINGLELVARARKLAHRSRTPIAMLSATPVEREALAVGADVFLRKPQDIGSVAEAILRLLDQCDR